MSVLESGVLVSVAALSFVSAATAQNHLYTFNGELAGDRNGISAAGVGDVNRDGHPDILVGAFLASPNGAASGKVRLFSGKDGRVLYTFNGDAAGDNFGVSVHGGGDVNKDGYPDMIVGAYRASPNGARSGLVRVFSGKDGKVLYTFNGDSAGDSLGFSVKDAGDVNKDGYADVIAGALYDDNNGTDSGSVRVFSGQYIFLKSIGSPNPGVSVLYTFNGDSAGDIFGYSARGVGDVNQDGYADVVVGAELDDNTGTDSGSARVLSGKALAVMTDIHAFSLAKANTQTLSLDAGTTNQGRLYWVFGSVTGTSPGVTLASALGLVTIPLNPDPWTDLTIALPNSPVLVNTKGTLDANGQAQAQIKGGPVNSPSAVGLVLYHAYLVYDAKNNFYMASNPATLLLEK
jgi:FG-GAP repeat